MQKPGLLIFDVNETLLSMKPLKEKVNTLLGTEQGFKIWFGMMLQYSLVDTVIKDYHQFPKIAEAALHMAAETLSVSLAEADVKQALTYVTQLPAHADVAPALNKLKNAGYRLVTLTNSPPQTLKDQLSFAGLTEFFEKALSIDAVKKYKPDADTYSYAAQTCGVEVSASMLVAAHGWDVAGATAAGLKTAFVSRKGQSLYPLVAKPDMVVKDLEELADKLIG